MSLAVQYNRKNPYMARLARMEVLTKPGSGKDTRHFEIDLTGSGMEYEPGDSLALQPNVGFSTNSGLSTDTPFALLGLQLPDVFGKFGLEPGADVLIKTVD